MTKFIQANRQLKLYSPLPEDDLLIQSIQGTEELSCLYEYRLDLLSPDDQIDGQELVGKRMTVEYLYDSGERRFINGFVCQLEYTGQTVHGETGDQMASYSAFVVPWLWFLDNRKDCRIFQEMDTPSIIREVFQKLGFGDFKLALQGSYSPREFCVQYRETDFNFISRLMEEEGIFYYFKHENGRHVMHLTDAVSGYYGLADSQVEMFKDQPHVPQIFSWRHAYQFRPGKVAQKDFNFVNPTDDLITDTRGKSKYNGAQNLEIYEYPGRYEDSGAGSRLTQVRMEELEARHDVAEGESNYISFAPGGKFKVKELARKSEKDKEFVLTRVTTHMGSNLGHSGSSYQNFFQAIPVGTIFRPERRATKPVIEGIQTAIITTDGKSEELVVDEHGRVKVQFHWDRYGKRDFHSSCWIRVSQVHAGKGWGMMDIPRMNEEVIVSFIDGDPDRPLITGRVYNGDNPVPFGLKGGSNAQNKTRRGNTTKTVGKGTSNYNEMSMDDTPGKEQIRVHAQYNLDTVIEHDETHTVHNNRTRIVGVNESMTIGNNQQLVVGVNQSVFIGNNQSNTVGMNKNELVGVMSNEVVGVTKTTTVGAVYALTVGAAMNEAVGFVSFEAVGLNKSLVVGQDYMVSVGNNFKLDVGNDFEQVIGNILKQTAGSKIEIVCGSSSITMDSGGKIVIQGTDVTLLAGAGKVNIDPGGIITIKGPMVKINT